MRHGKLTNYKNSTSLISTNATLESCWIIPM